MGKGSGGAGVTAVGDSYSAAIGFIFVFNLVVGVGVLSLPKAFHEAGWVLSTFFLSFICVLSYVCATWVVEAQASANAKMVHDAAGSAGEAAASGRAGSLQEPMLDAVPAHLQPYKGGVGRGSGQGPEGIYTMKQVRCCRCFRCCCSCPCSCFHSRC